MTPTPGRPAMDGFRAELQASIERTLLAEARRNELTIAHVRAITLAFATALDVLLHVQPPGFRLPYAFSIVNPILAGAWLLAALAVVATLRRGWYRPWLRLALPLLDGLIVTSLFVSIFLTAGSVESVRPAVANTGIACALLAVTGALRLNRIAAWVTTALAVVAFGVVALLAGNALPETVFGCALLVGVGFLGGWLNDIARRAMESEVGRQVLGRFLPAELVQGAHQQLLAFITQPRRLVATVLVSDLRGFTAHAERLPPERVLEQLNQVQSALAAAVQAHGGQVDKFMGDGLLAVFGLAGDAQEHAAQGVAAARAMLAAMDRLAAEADYPVRLGIGLHTGPLVAGCLGSGRRLEFTVLGDTVNTASRLQDLTKDKGVSLCVSGATLQALASAGRVDGADWTALGSTTLRGRQAPLELFAPVHPGRAAAHG